jgi:transcriptional regulator with XRE-family HTH domain
MERSRLVAQRIRELREKKFFQKDFAAHIDMKPSTYSDKENGNTEITIGELYRIADGLETTVAFLLGIEEASTQNNTNSIVLNQNHNGTIYFQPSQEMVDKLVGEKK